MTLPLTTETRQALNLTVTSLSALITPTDTKELLELSTLARRVRANTPRLGRNRRAAIRLDALLLHHRTRGVTVEHLAQATGADAYELERRLGHRSQRYIQRYTNPPEEVAAAYVEEF